MKNLYTSLFLLFLMNSLSAQVTFTNGNDRLVSTDNHSGVAIAVADMNGDKLDDIIRLLNGTQICIELQQNDGTFSRDVYQTVGNDSQWSISVADIDNNGFRDILCGGSYDGIKVYYANDQGTDYTAAVLPGPTMFAQCSNLADINNDGHLDAFVCHDDAESRIWSNDGTGVLEMADDWIDMTTTPSSDNSGNYGSVWSDFDLDGDIDLYIAKCRQFVNNPENPLRINALFVNDGLGNYTEMADEYGLKIGNQSWTADFGDIDNDGDFDCFITNHGSPSQVLENDGTGHFTDISSTAGIGTLDFAIQGLLMDFDNDGFMDIIVSGGSHYYFHNNGDKTFTEVNGFIENGETLHSYGLGDLNHDGFVDINGSYGAIYTTPTSEDDVIWLNDKNDNHWFVLDLEGTDSNRSAIGAHALIYGAWGVQIREVRAGESYGISNTSALHFGLGAATEIDSVIVNWPSGNIDKIENPLVDQFLTVVEKQCVVGGLIIEADGPVVFCDGDDVVISAPTGFDAYEWSNGSTESSITVTESGGYRVTITTGDCSAASNIITVDVNPDATPTILEGSAQDICPDESITLTSSSLVDNTWSTGEISNSIEVDEGGTYTVSVQGLCNEFSSLPFVVKELTVDDLQVTEDTVLPNESATLGSNGFDPQWYDAETGGTLLGTGNSFTTDPLAETTTFYVEAQQEFGPPQQVTGALDNSGDGFFTDDPFRGLEMEILEVTILESVKVYAETAGATSFAVFDFSSGNQIFDQEVMLVAGEQTVDLNFTLPAEDRLVLYHNANNNSPALYILNDDSSFEFPYEIPSLLSINSSINDASTYDCFYELKFRKGESKYCMTDRFPVIATVDFDSGVDLIEAGKVNIFPNPVLDQVTFTSEDVDKYELEIYDGLGRIVIAQNGVGHGTVISMSELESGAYFVKVKNESGAIAVKRLIKI